MDWTKRRRLDFWLLAGMVGLWVYWLFLYQTGLLDSRAIRFYFWLFWRNKLLVLLLGIVFVIAIWCFRQRRWGVGMGVILLTASLGYWEYGPDFPKVLPLNPPKVLWGQTLSGIPVVMVISYTHRRELPPHAILRFEEWIHRQNVRVKKDAVQPIHEQAQKVLVKLAQKAGEDPQLFEKCLKVAFNYVINLSSEPHLLLCAEKRYEHVTGQLCWIFGFVRLRQEKNGSSSFWKLSPLIDPWVAVRLRFPQKAWLTYLAIEPEHALRDLFLVLVIVAGYVAFLKVLRYAFDRWF